MSIDRSNEGQSSRLIEEGHLSHTPDYHVISLTYSVMKSDGVVYDAALPVEFEVPEAQFRLAELKMICRMKVHTATADEARAIVEPVLRAWEITADLGRGVGELRFRYEDVDIVDRTPVPPGAAAIHGVLAGLTGMAFATSASHVIRHSYPPPPEHFRITPDVETLWHRYQGYIEGREPLLAMAYFCLTVLESTAGGRRDAAVKYNIDFAVLRKLGEVSSERGDHRTARKGTTRRSLPLTANEQAWVQAVIKHMISRAGDILSVGMQNSPLVGIEFSPPIIDREIADGRESSGGRGSYRRTG